MDKKEVTNIYQRLAAITAELKTVSKNLEVGFGKSKYKAVSERDILDVVKPLEEKYGVYSYPCNREILESNILESETENGKKTTFMTRIKTTYLFVNVDNPDDFISTVTFAEGIDPQDKGSGKAMTYADKYALMKAYKISTGDDPDEEASKDENYTKKAETITPKAKTTKTKTPRERLIAKLGELGIDKNEYAAKYNLDKKTTPERYEELLKELDNE